jgi:hypothetical protein
MPPASPALASIYGFSLIAAGSTAAQEIHPKPELIQNVGLPAHDAKGRQ